MFQDSRGTSIALVRFKPTSLGLDYDDDAQSNSILIEIPAALKRCGMAMKLIINPEIQRPTRKKDTTTMIALLAKANDWFSRLKSGECKSISELANEDGSSKEFRCQMTGLSKGESWASSHEPSHIETVEKAPLRRAEIETQTPACSGLLRYLSLFLNNLDFMAEREGFEPSIAL